MKNMLLLCVALLGSPVAFAVCPDMRGEFHGDEDNVIMVVSQNILDYSKGEIECSKISIGGGDGHLTTYNTDGVTVQDKKILSWVGPSLAIQDLSYGPNSRFLYTLTSAGLGLEAQMQGRQNHKSPWVNIEKSNVVLIKHGP